MANTVTGLFETLVLPAAASIQAPNMLRNSMIRKVTVLSEPIPGRPKSTINVNIPAVNEGDVVDIGNGPVQITDQDHATVAMVVNNNKSKAYRVPDFDQIRSPVELQTLYFMPAIESVLRKVNRSVCNLVNTSNFNVHSSITGGADTFSRANIATAWSNLQGVGLPDSDSANLNFVTGHIPYSNMIADTSWIQESIVGIGAAEEAQQRARLMPAFEARIDYDPMMPQPSVGATYAGLLFHKSSIAIVPVLMPMGNKPHIGEMAYQVPGSGLTFRVQLWYDPREQAWIFHVHCVYALAVVRPNLGSYLVST